MSGSASPDALPAAVSITLDVNGTTHSLGLDPRTSLLDLVREHLRLTGTKKGCNSGECGACTVHLDGRRVNACMVLAASCDGRRVTTIEGLAEGDRLHPVQQAFIDHDAFQCGFCTPGQIMSAVSCIDEGHTATDAEIREWMSGNLCRCSAYPQIVAAVRAASEAGGALMLPFAYERADSVQQAVIGGAAGDSMFLAGGTELLNWLRLGLAAPAHVIDVSRLAGLDAIETLPNGGLRIGALVRLNDAAQHAAVMRDYPVLSQAILKAASAQLRNLATIGGNPVQRTRCPYYRAEEDLPCNKRAPGSGCAARHGINDRHAIFGWTDECVAVQPSDPAVALAVLDAEIVTERAEGGRRIPARLFHTLPSDGPERHNVLQAGELIVAIELPAPARRSAYVKVRERESYEYATVSAAVALDMDGDTIRAARVALGSVAARPWRLEATERLLAGTRIGSPEMRAAIAAGFADARPLSHNAHKIPLARNAALRALDMAARMA